MLAHSYDESIQWSRKALELDPNFALAHNHLGQAYLQKHMTDQAIAELKIAVTLSHDAPTCTANLARAYAASGDRVGAERLLSDLRTRSRPGQSFASEIAAISAALGDRDQALDWLERGYTERFNPGVLIRPGFDSLRGDPRFQDLERRVGFPR